MSINDRHKLRKLRTYSTRLNRMIGDGTFEDLPARKRGKLVRRVRALYEDLAGVVSEAALGHILAAAAVLVLGTAGCGGSGGGPVPDGDADVDVQETLDGEVPDQPDMAGEPDVGDDDAEDAPEVLDAPDAVDAPDVVDAPDAVDAVDVVDAPDMVDVVDVVDAPDVVDVIDVVDVADVTDAADVDADDGGTVTLFTGPTMNPFGFSTTYTWSMPAVADIDDDGDLDLFVGTEGLLRAQLSYYQNTGSATAPAFAAPVPGPFGFTTAAAFITPDLRDLDGDGDLDLLTGADDIYSTRGDLQYYQNTGNATSPAFAGALTNPFGLTYVDTYASPAFVDIDGDSDLDLFVGQLGGSVRYFQNTGSATAPAFAAPVTDPFGITPVYGYAAPAFADLDIDGDKDLLVGEDGGNLLYFENTGTATSPAFASALVNPLGLSAVYGYALPEFADLDGDGDMDLLVGEQYAYGDLQYFENTTY